MFDQFSDADAMIRANGEAERREREKLSAEVEEYRRKLEELTAMLNSGSTQLQELSEANQVNADGLKAMMQESGEEENDEANELLASLLGLTAAPEAQAPESAPAVPETAPAEEIPAAVPETAPAEEIPAAVPDTAPAEEIPVAVPETAPAAGIPAAVPASPADPEPVQPQTSSEEDFIRNLLFGFGGTNDAQSGADPETAVSEKADPETGKPAAAADAEPDASAAQVREKAVPERAEAADASQADGMTGLTEETTLRRVSELLERNRAAIAGDLESIVKSASGLTREDIADLLERQPKLTKEDITDLLERQPKLSRQDVSDLLKAQPRMTSAEMRAILASQPMLTATDVRGILASQPRLTAEDVEEIVSRQAGNTGDAESLRAKAGEELAERISSRFDELENRYAERLDEADKKTYHTGVQVYRNVQASMIEELDHQTKALETAISEVKDNQKALEESMKRLEAHIKVVEEINEEDEEMDDELYGLVKATLIISVISLVLTSLHAFGVTDAILRILGLE